MTAYRIHWPGIIAALLLAPTLTASAKGADDLPLGDEIHRRFGDDADAADDQHESLEQFALKFTQSINSRGEVEVGEVVVDERSFVWRPRHVFFQGRVVSRPRLVEAAHLEDDVEPAPRDATLVERFITEGFPSGTGQWTVEEDWTSDHVFSYSLAAKYAPHHPEDDPRFVSGAGWSP